MRLSFFPKIAINGIRKNKKLYYPYFFTCMTVIAMFYILSFVSSNESISKIPAGAQLQLITSLGMIVLGFFSVLFMFYTNSFLVKRKMKEFGLYNVLGMSKRNLAIVLFFETLFIGAISIVLGLSLGVLFSKVAELLLVKLVKGIINMEFEISWNCILITFILFVCIFILIYIYNVIKVSSTRAINLVKAEEEGEKAPKANWLIALLGVILLGYAYYTSITIKNAFSAIIMFFIAVLIVIAATFMLFISGSVVVCKLMQKNKNYYYKINHFISTSTMSFRMKRNGAGLATICILSTMVLVMISSTASLYYGSESAIEGRYHHDYQIAVGLGTSDMMNEENISYFRDYIHQAAVEMNLEEIDQQDYFSYDLSGIIDGETMTFSEYDLSNVNQLITLDFISLEDYNKIAGKNLTLKDNEALFIDYSTGYQGDKIILEDIVSYDLIRSDEEFVYGIISTSGIANSACMIIKNYQELLDKTAEAFDRTNLYVDYIYQYDVNADVDTKVELRSKIFEKLQDCPGMCAYYSNSCREYERSDFYATYGSLFFLGITLSIVFIFTTVMIIYYKQISEGYEDQKRFEIMKKVGMSQKTIRKTVNTQMLTVFYLPLVVAGIHLACAFPMIQHLLEVFNLYDPKPLLIATIVCILIYAIVYAIIYRMTSISYYSIIDSSSNE